MQQFKQRKEQPSSRPSTEESPQEYAREWGRGNDFVGQHALHTESDAEFSTKPSTTQDQGPNNWTDSGQIADGAAIAIPSSFQLPMGGGIGRSTYTPFGDESQDTSLMHILGSDLFRGALDGDFQGQETPVQLDPVPYPVMDLPGNGVAGGMNGAAPPGHHQNFSHSGAFDAKGVGLASRSAQSSEQQQFAPGNSMSSGYQPLHSSFYSLPRQAYLNPSDDAQLPLQPNQVQKTAKAPTLNGNTTTVAKETVQLSHKDKKGREQSRKSTPADRRQQFKNVPESTAVASSDKDGSSQERKSEDSATSSSTAATVVGAQMPVSGSQGSLDGSHSSFGDNASKDFKDRGVAVEEEGTNVDDATVQPVSPFDSSSQRQGSKKKKKNKKSKGDGKECESEENSPQFTAAVAAQASEIPAMPEGTKIEELDPGIEQEATQSKSKSVAELKAVHPDQASADMASWSSQALHAIRGFFGQPQTKDASDEKIAQKGNGSVKSGGAAESGRANKKQKFHASRKAAAPVQQDEEDLDEDFRSKKGGAGFATNTFRESVRSARAYLLALTKPGPRKRSKGKNKTIFSMRTALFLLFLWVVLITTPGDESSQPEESSFCHGTSKILSTFCPWGFSWVCSAVFPRIEMLCLHMEWLGSVLSGWARLWSSIGKALWLPAMFDRMAGSSSRALQHKGRVTHCSLLPLQHHCSLDGHGHYDRLRWHLDTVLHMLELERVGSFGPDGRCVGERCISLSISSWVAGFRRPIGAYTLLCKQQFGEGSEFDGEMCACREGFVVKGGVCRRSSGTGDSSASGEEELVALEPKFKGRKLHGAAKSDAKCASKAGKKGKKPRVKSVRKLDA